MPTNKLDIIIQESINNGVALKLLWNISSELSVLSRQLSNISSNIPKDVLSFINKLNEFTENVINAIKQCVKYNSLDEANEMAKVDQMNIDPIGFINRLGNNLYRDLASGGILGNVRRNPIEKNKSQIHNHSIKLKVLITNIYPKIRKEYASIDSKYSSIFSQAKSREMIAPMRIIGKMDEIDNTMKNAQGKKP